MSTCMGRRRMAGVKETTSEVPKPLTEKDLGRIDEALRGWFGRDDAQLLVEHPAKPGALHPGVTKSDVRPCNGPCRATVSSTRTVVVPTARTRPALRIRSHASGRTE